MLRVIKDQDFSRWCLGGNDKWTLRHIASSVCVGGGGGGGGEEYVK